MNNKIKVKVTAETTAPLTPADEEALADAVAEATAAKLAELGYTVSVQPLGIIIQA